MRIAFVTSGYPPDLGGVETVVAEMARRMSLAGDDVEVFTHSAQARRSTSEWQDGVLVKRFRVPLPSREFAVAPGMIVELRRRRRAFDVVHAHNFHALPALAAAATGMRPLVFSPYFHGGGHTRAARVAHVAYRPLSRVLFNACAHIVNASDAEGAALREAMPHINAPMTTVPIGVDAEFESAPPLVEDLPVVLAAGRMESYKRFDRLVLAAAELSADARVVLIGDGPERRAIEQLARSMGLGARVRLLGRVSDEDRHRWFRTAKVVVSLSMRESFGLTLAEALSAGAAVVASDIPAHREIARQQPSGAVRLVAVDADPSEVAGAIDDAIVSGRPSGTHVASWDESVTRLLNIYESVRLAGAPRRRSARTST